MHIDGKGGVGFTTGTATIELQEQPGPVTVMNYTSDVQIGGRIAGGRTAAARVGRQDDDEAGARRAEQGAASCVVA